jgi:class 3 adenylate cyclase
MGDEITARGGTIVKYIGDSVLATFPDGAERQAVAAALAMRRAMAALVARWGIEGDCDLEVAVSAGPVTRGLFGHRSLRTMDVLGGTVNEAAVLTRYRGVVVTGPVNEALAGEFRTEPLADFPLKWRGEPLRAWRLVEGG